MAWISKPHLNYMKNKNIYLLIGPKGSGKSWIGSLLEREFGIKFIRVEDWAKQTKRDRAVDDEAYLRQVFESIEKGIRSSLMTTNQLFFESTGLTEYFDRMYHSLKKDFRVVTIGIIADPKTCLERVKTRDQKIHINISDDQVHRINEMVQTRDFPTDFRLINQSKTQQDVIEELEYIILD